MAARDVLSKWRKSQKNRQEAYKNLYTALKENEMNQLAAELKESVEETEAQTLGTKIKSAATDSLSPGTPEVDYSALEDCKCMCILGNPYRKDILNVVEIVHQSLVSIM